jgi:hypothetical protein
MNDKRVLSDGSGDKAAYGRAACRPPEFRRLEIAMMMGLRRPRATKGSRQLGSRADSEFRKDPIEMRTYGAMG